ncbi:parallel beta-helix domain-containing protein [Reinekea sp.]|jgi:parallel beta-helix repeat protein|uniref:parallel beta-helix domain-containing protein n=1 Tax=Reinekea sp. TaxID=1970455 RepID=UPI0039896B7D
MRLKKQIIIALVLCVFGLSAHAEVIKVKKGKSIQLAVHEAQPGDIIEIQPGVYHETVFIDKDDITIRGIVKKGEWPVLDGEKVLNDAILYSGNGITIESLKIINYKGNGIMGQAGNNFLIRNNFIHDAGVYGIFPQFGQNGLIEHNVLSGIEDAAIYVGMSDNIDVRHNEVYESVAGIEIENSRFALVENNYVHDNAGGILAFALPGLPIKTASDIIIRDNFVVNNNHVNFAPEGSIVATVPTGTGIMLISADNVTIENNIITNNGNAGITILDAKIADIGSDPDHDPDPDGIKIYHNLMANNGHSVAGDMKTLMKLKFTSTGPDVFQFGGSKGSCILEESRYRVFGLNKFDDCEAGSNTADITTMMLDEPVPPRDTSGQELGKRTFYAVCSGCHTYENRIIGPPIKQIQERWGNSAEAVAAYILMPARINEGYPEMPPQYYLSEEVRLAVSEYMLNLKK